MPTTSSSSAAVTSGGAGVDEGGHDQARPHHQRGEDLAEGRSVRAVRLPWLRVRPALQRPGGKRYLGYSPSKKSIGRIKDKVGDLLVPGNLGAWTDVRDRLNRLLRGWMGYFSHGTLSAAYRDVEGHVYDRVRNFHRRRHKVPTRGTREFSGTHVFGELGVLRLERPKPTTQP